MSLSPPSRHAWPRQVRLALVCASLGYSVGLFVELLEQLADDRARWQASRIAAAQAPVVLLIRDPDATDPEGDEL